MSTDAATEPFVTPALNAEMWDHQKEAFNRAVEHEGYMLGHEVGCGKSLAAIALLEHDQAQRVLILCPKSVLGVWPAQLNGPLDPPGPPQGFSPRRWDTWSGRVLGARGPKKNPSVTERALALMDANTDAIKLSRPFAAVVNYEASFQGDMRALLLGTEWDALICDESHRLKLPSGKASRLAAQIGERVRSRGGRVLCLTGTPMPHSELDIWAQAKILDGGRRFGQSNRYFLQTYADTEQIYVPGGKVRSIYTGVRPGKMKAFTEQLSSFVHIVKADEVLDLPEAVDRYTPVDLSSGARSAYEDLERHGIAEAEGGTLTAANAMVLVLRLAQATNGFGTDVDSGAHVALDPGRRPDKAQAIADFLEDLPTREPVVVFCRFHADLDAVEAICEAGGRRYGELSGRRRDGLTEQSRMSPDIDVLGAQTRSGGVGIDLTRARIAAYYSLDFTLADYLQSRGRLVRPGQSRPVLFQHFLVNDTVDWAIYGALRKRQEVISSVIAHLQRGGKP